MFALYNEDEHHLHYGDEPDDGEDVCRSSTSAVSVATHGKVLFWREQSSCCVLALRQTLSQNIHSVRKNGRKKADQTNKCIAHSILIYPLALTVYLMISTNHLSQKF